MPKKFIANGARIKELRANSMTPLPQKLFAERCRISERQLRRIENDNQRIELSQLQRIATELRVGIEEIAFGTQGPVLVTPQGKAEASSVTARPEPETTIIPRHTTTHLRPVATAQALYELARDSMEVIPLVLVDAPAAQMAMIKECLALLKAVSDHRWSCGAPVPGDVHDSADFPEINRRTRLAELFVLIKGHDIRIVAEREIYQYPAGARPWLEGQKTCFQVVVGFAAPRGEYDEEYVVVPFDAGSEVVLPWKPIF
jgi:transcriptional regulator with XRE-family HTH domain